MICPDCLGEMTETHSRLDEMEDWSGYEVDEDTGIVKLTGPVFKLDWTGGAP